MLALGGDRQGVVTFTRAGGSTGSGAAEAWPTGLLGSHCAHR